MNKQLALLGENSTHLQQGMGHSSPPSMAGAVMLSSDEKVLTDCASESQLQGSHSTYRKVQAKGLLFLFVL